jgi:hypothetical protein
MPANSYGQDHLMQTAGARVHDAEVQSKELQERKDAVQLSRASHFNLNYASKGTADADYLGFKAQNAGATHAQSAITKPDLRSASFSIGTEATAYVSSYKDCHNQSVVDNLPKPEPGELSQKERVTKARQQQFSYGKDMPTYQSLSKAAFQPKSLGASSRSVAKDLEKKIRASHVTMGNDGTFAMVEKQPERDAVNQRLGIPQQGKKDGFTRERPAENKN